MVLINKAAVSSWEKQVYQVTTVSELLESNKYSPCNAFFLPPLHETTSYQSYPITSHLEPVYIIQLEVMHLVGRRGNFVLLLLYIK